MILLFFRHLSLIIRRFPYRPGNSDFKTVLFSIPRFDIAKMINSGHFGMSLVDNNFVDYYKKIVDCGLNLTTTLVFCGLFGRKKTPHNVDTGGGIAK